MAGLLGLRAENYRSLKRVDVALGRLNVLVGPNGSGKSNFLDMIQFLGDSVRTDLAPAIEARGGFERIYFRGKTSGPVRIGVSANITRNSSPSAPDDYELAFNVRRYKTKQEMSSILWRNEEFLFKRTQGRGRRLKIKGNDVAFLDVSSTGSENETFRKPLLLKDSLALATLPRLAEEEGGGEVAKFASLLSSFRIFDVNVDGARRPSRYRGAHSLRPDASNLAAYLYYLWQEDEVRFERLERDAAEIVPGLRELQFNIGDVGDGPESVSIELNEHGLIGGTPLADASFGTIRALALLALLYDPSPPLLTIIEEVDHGFHPYVFDLLVERMREASHRTQFVVATHSPAFVNRLKPQELIVCERDPETGASNIPAVPTDYTAQLMQELEGQVGLGEVWFTGSLGGVPG